MSTSNVAPLDPSRSYIFCPRCEQDGHEGVEMRKDAHRYICPLMHELDLQAVQRLIASGRKLHMVPLIQEERPSPNQVQQKVWVHPETWAKLQTKFKGRFLVTLDVFFNLLADDQIIFISGEDATKLRRFGITSGKDIVAMAEARKELEETHRALIQRLSPVFAAAQQAGEL